jgi:hypothetical protein
MGLPIVSTCAQRWQEASNVYSTTRASRDSCCHCAPISSWRPRSLPLASNARLVSYICPETERASHYFHARLPEQFDYVLHFDETRAVEPLERTALWEAAEVAETFPSGL